MEYNNIPWELLGITRVVAPKSQRVDLQYFVEVYNLASSSTRFN